MNDAGKDSESGGLSQYPEAVQFTGVMETSLKPVHFSSILLIIVGILVAISLYPTGLLLLVAFLVIVLLYESWMIRKSEREIRISLLLREDPVGAMQGSDRVGEISTGSIETEMEDPNKLGFRPAPDRELIVWTFDSKEDAQTVAKRLLEYLPRDNANQ